MLIMTTQAHAGQSANFYALNIIIKPLLSIKLDCMFIIMNAYFIKTLHIICGPSVDTNCEIRRHACIHAYCIHVYKLHTYTC